MKYKVEFQYNSPREGRPYDYAQEMDISSDTGAYIPIPTVGDSVSLKLHAEDERSYKVLTRHFSYLANLCCVNIVVTDIPDDEMAARLKM